MNVKKLPIGMSDFKCVVSENYYYVDKSLFIKEVLEKSSKITLIPRPRRFGKTLNISMLQYFFEKTYPSIQQPARPAVPAIASCDGWECVQSTCIEGCCGLSLGMSVNRCLFDNLEISKHPECMKHLGKYPVIFLTFKDVKQDNWDDCYDKLKTLIADEYHRHEYLLESDVLHEMQKKDFREIINKTASYSTFCDSLKNLSVHLTKFHNQRPIILLDEYDAPIQHGFLKKYYDKIIDYTRNFLSTALKDNDQNLEFSIITGIMRIAKESIFSGLNNLSVYTMTDQVFMDKFGLTESEIDKVLEDFDAKNYRNEVKSWYNGYTAGITEAKDKIVRGVKLYNPWSIINFLNKQNTFSVYWVNTSSNDLVKQLIRQDSTGALKQDLDTLLSGGAISKQLNDNIIFSELYNQLGVVWNFLLFTGYLTYKKMYKKNDGTDFVDLVIPNNELKIFWKNIIQGWFQGPIGKKQDYVDMLDTLIKGDIKTFCKIFQSFTANSFSYFDVGGDEPERFYHAFVLGMLAGLSNEFVVKTNRESGYGRYDVLLIPRDVSMHGVIFEFKKVDEHEKETLEIAVQEAMKQIEDKNYEAELLAHGVAKEKIFKLGIAFEGKKVLIKTGPRVL